MGMIHINCGEGKGKTSAACGLAIRCAGYGKRVVIARFMKDNNSGELKILERIEEITVLPITRSFGFTWNMTDEDKKEAKVYYTEFLQKAIQTAKEQNASLLVLDEIIATYNYNLCEQKILVEFLNSVPESLEVVMTGRNPAQELVELADYISEIKKVKHPFDQGIPAREGIEY